MNGRKEVQALQGFGRQQSSGDPDLLARCCAASAQPAGQNPWFGLFASFGAFLRLQDGRDGG